MITKDILHQFIEGKALEDSLLALSEHVSGRIAFSTSFGIEDQIITDAIFTLNIRNIEVFTLDTGRLFPETYDLWQKTEQHYGIKIKALYPEAEPLEKFVGLHGINAFYDSVELRKKCCYLRKVAPLKRALEGVDLWVTGIRAEHSADRGNLSKIQWDPSYNLHKFNPLLNWTSEEVKKYAVKFNVPYSPLHDKGFVSIGCAPCTRAITESEDFRAGRWWWEQETKKECGLHFSNN